MGSQPSAKVRRTQDLYAERSSNGSPPSLRKNLSSVLESALHSCHSPRAVYSVRSWYWDTMAGGFKTFTDYVKAAAPQLEPTLEAALRKYDVHEDITARRLGEHH